MSPRRLLYWRWLLWKSQYYPPDKLMALQWKLLSRLLDHCFNNVPYYARLFARLGLHPSDFISLEDLSRLPILTKDVLLEHCEGFKANNFKRYQPHAVPTSGTTGTPMFVYWDISSNAMELTAQWRHYSWAGYRLGDAFLDIRSRKLDAPNNWRWNWRCQGLEMSSDHIDASNIAKFAGMLRRYRVKLWRGHPSAIDLVCRLLKDSAIDDVRPKCVITASEMLLDHQRKFVESWTGVPVCDSYGLVEHTALICQCPEGGYHIAPEYGIVEIIKEDGTPAQSGEEGRIISTGLHNRAWPLLRYDTMDYAIPSDHTCSCGRTLPLVQGFTGRIDDRLLTADGKWISGLYRSVYFADRIRMAQLVQEEPLAVDAYVVPLPNYNENAEARLRAQLKSRLGNAMEIRVHRVDDVPYQPPGKFKFVVCKLRNAPP